MASATRFVNSCDQESPRISPADLPGPPSPTLRFAAGLTAAGGGGSALAKEPTSNGDCDKMERRKPNEAGEQRRRKGTLLFPADLGSEQALGGGHWSIPGTRELYAHMCQRECSLNTILPATQLSLLRQMYMRDNCPALTLEELMPPTQRGEHTLNCEAGSGVPCHKKVPETSRRVGARDGGFAPPTHNVAAMRNSACVNTRESSDITDSLMNISPDNFRRKADAVLGSMLVALQGCNNGSGVCNIKPTHLCNGDNAGVNEKDTSSMLMWDATSPPVDAATKCRPLRAAAKAPTYSFWTVGGNNAVSVVAQGASKAYSPSHSNEWPASASNKALAREMASVSTSSNTLPSATLQSVSLPRVDCDRSPPPSAAELLSTPTARTPAITCGDNTILLLLERILGKATAALPISTLASCLANALQPPLPVLSNHIGSAGGGTSTPSPRAATNENDFISPYTLPELLRANVTQCVYHRVAAVEGVGAHATAVGIQKLPPGKRLEDYYIIGPVLDVCVPPQQVSHPDTRGRLPHKRAHSPETPQRGESRERRTTHKVSKYGRYQKNPSEATVPTSNNTNFRWNPEEEAALRKVIESRYNAGLLVLNAEGRSERANMHPPPAHGVDGNKESTTTPLEFIAERARESSACSPPSSCRNVQVPEKQVEDKSRREDIKPTQANKRPAPDAAHNSSRPILRFAVARSLPPGVQSNRVKIIKSIQKRRIPTSAGGDRLWRRLCERLLNLPAHPNVLSVEAILEDAAYYHFVFERLEGGELFAFLLREKMVDEHVCRYIIYQILMALHHLHSHNLLHRDVKPENLVFRRRQQKIPERFPQYCAGSGVQSCYSHNSSSSVLPNSSWKEGSSSRSPSHLYAGLEGGHCSPTTSWTSSSTSSSSSSFSTSCTTSASGRNNSYCCAAGPSSAHYAGSSPLSDSRISTQRTAVPSSPANSGRGNSKRKSKVCDSEEVTLGHILPFDTEDDHETVQKQYVQTCGGRCAENMLLHAMRDYELVLIDFDTCKMTDVPAELYGEVVGGRRRLVGTYGYLAPEVLCGHVYSTQSDLWSVGIILYILMTGVPPIPLEEMVSARTSLKVFLEMHEKQSGIPFHVPPLSDSPLAQDLCKRLLRLSPKERLSSAWAALSHPWFDNLHCVGARGNSRSVTSHSCGTSPVVARENLPYRARMIFEGLARCNPSRVPASTPPLKSSPLREGKGGSSPTWAPEKTTLGSPYTSAPVLSPISPADGLLTHDWVHVFPTHIGEQQKDQSSRNPTIDRKCIISDRCFMTHSLRTDYRLTGSR